MENLVVGEVTLQPFEDDDIGGDNEEVVRVGLASAGLFRCLLLPAVEGAPDHGHGHHQRLAGAGGHLEGVAHQAQNGNVHRCFPLRVRESMRQIAPTFHIGMDVGWHLQKAQARRRAEFASQILEVGEAAHLGQIDQRLDRLTLGKVVAETISSQEMIFIEPEVVQPPGHV